MKQIKITDLKKPIKLKIKTKDNEYIITTIGKKSKTGTISSLPNEKVTLNGALVGPKLVKVGWIVVGYPLQVMRHETKQPIFYTEKITSIRKLK